MKTPEEIAESLVGVRELRDSYDGEDRVSHAVFICGVPVVSASSKRAAEAHARTAYRAPIADAVRPLYEDVGRLEGLLAVVCHDDAGLIELGRREERGRALAMLREKESTLDAASAVVSAYAAEAERAGFAAFVVRGLVREVEAAGPACGPLPPAAAAERIAKLEGAIREVVRLSQFDGSAVLRHIGTLGRQALEG